MGQIRNQKGNRKHSSFNNCKNTKYQNGWEGDTPALRDKSTVLTTYWRRKRKFCTNDLSFKMNLKISRRKQIIKIRSMN